MLPADDPPLTDAPPTRDESPPADPLPVEQLTWAVLLGRWVEFARSAVALPDDAAGRRWRAVVPDMIQLQAVWFALESWPQLAPQQRALALDRAEVLVDRHHRNILRAWERPASEAGGIHAADGQDQRELEQLPEALTDLIDDSRAAVAHRRAQHTEALDAAAQQQQQQ